MTEMHDILRRFLTVVVGVSIMLTFLTQLGEIGIIILFGVIALGCVFEFWYMTGFQYMIPSVFLTCSYLHFTGVQIPDACFYACLIEIAASQVIHGEVEIHGYLYSMFLALTVLIPLSSFVELYQLDWRFPIIVLSMTWWCDGGAYFAGKFAGTHKLCPSISPKKTIEGTLGGAVASYIMCYLTRYILWPDYNLYDWFILNTICIFCGALGDLFESAIKRICGVKDSGFLIVGHGGFLDRFDSVLAATIPCLAYITA